MRVPYTFFVKRDLGFCYLFVIRDCCPYLIFVWTWTNFGNCPWCVNSLKIFMWMHFAKYRRPSCMWLTSCGQIGLLYSLWWWRLSTVLHTHKLPSVHHCAPQNSGALGTSCKFTPILYTDSSKRSLTKEWVLEIEYQYWFMTTWSYIGFQSSSWVAP